MSKNSSILKSASVISFATLCSRLLGFLRDILIAAFFGTGWISEAFFVAFRIPNLLRHLVGEGAANAAFVPVFCEYQIKKDEKKFWEMFANGFWIFLLILIGLTLAGILFSRPIVSLIAPGFLLDAQKFSLTVRLTRILFPYLLLIGLTAYAMGLLHTFKSFAAPAFGPCLLNACIIAGMLIAYYFLPQPVFGLAFGVLLGGIFQIAVQIPSLFRCGFRHRLLKAKPNLSHPGIKKIRRLLIPRIFGAAVYQLNILVDTVLASFSVIVGQGAVAAIYYANRLIHLPLSLFGIALSSAVLPVLSSQAAVEDIKSLKSTLVFSLRALYFLLLPASLGLLVFAEPIIKVLFQRGSFDHYSVQISSAALFFYAIGLVFFGGVKILTTGFYSLQDTRTPVAIAAVTLLLNLILNIVLMFPLKVGGLALASSLSAGLNFSFLYVRLRKKIGAVFTPGLIFYFLKISAAGLIMAVFAKLFFKNTAFYLSPALGLGATIVLAALVYLGACLLLRAQTAGSLIRWIKKK